MNRGCGRRDFLKLALAGTCLGGAAGAGLLSRGCAQAAPDPAAAAAAAPRPNFVLILMDDLGYADIEPFGSPHNRTPHLAQLAREGMKLTSFYTCPVCTPSRAQFMTGCYAQRVSLPKVVYPGDGIGLNPQERTIASLLKQRGYSTMCIGKWHLGDQPEHLPTRHGFDHYFGLPYSNDMAPDVPAAGKEAARRRVYPPLPLMRDERVVETVSLEQQEALTARYTAEAVSFIDRHKERPFFLFLSHTAVHRPHRPGRAFEGRSGHGEYDDWVLEADWSVGQVMDALRRNGLAENTLVVFASDNGGVLPEADNRPFRGGKHSTLEGGMRSPAIAWWPGKIPAGTVSDAITVNFDLLPTFVKLAGGKVPDEPVIDGKDIWPILSGVGDQSPHEFFCYFLRRDLQAVRSGPWKLAVSNLTPVALYNLDADPGESADVAADHPDVVQRLLEAARKLHAELGTMRSPGVRPPGKVDQPRLPRLEAEPAMN